MKQKYVWQIAQLSTQQTKIDMFSFFFKFNKIKFSITYISWHGKKQQFYITYFLAKQIFHCKQTCLFSCFFIYFNF